MTALKEYARLESGGVWRETPDDAPRDVVVSFGDATLVIADSAGLALSHWSLPAVRRRNPGTRPAEFTPDAEVDETLTIDDPLMIDAIEKVRKSVARSRPKQTRSRFLWSGAIIIGLLAGSILWLPGALRDQTLAVVPQAKRSEIGATVLGHMQFLTGPSCSTAQGRQALEQLHQRLLGRQAAGQIIVLPSGTGDAVALPGGIIVLDKTIPETTDDPTIAAGYILAAHTQRVATDPLDPILADAGLRVTFTLFTTGEMPAEALKDYAKHLVNNERSDPDISALRSSFDIARVPSAPYGAHRNIPSLVTDDPMQDITTTPVLGDGAWVSLQGICDG